MGSNFFRAKKGTKHRFLVHTFWALPSCERRLCVCGRSGWSRREPRKGRNDSELGRPQRSPSHVPEKGQRCDETQFLFELSLSDLLSMSQTKKEYKNIIDAAQGQYCERAF